MCGLGSRWFFTLLFLDGEKKYSRNLTLRSKFFDVPRTNLAGSGSSCYDDPHSDVIKRTRLRIGKVICEFVSYNIPTFLLLPLKGFVFMFLLPIFRSYFQKTRLGLSLHFKPNLQSIVCILYLQEIWPLSTRLIPNFSVSPGFPIRRSTTASFQTDLSFV